MSEPLTCRAPLWPEDTDWSSPDINAAWVDQWPLCGAALTPEQAARAMAYCDPHEADWHEALADAGRKGIVVALTTADDRP